jgi:hypothetical protein
MTIDDREQLKQIAESADDDVRLSRIVAYWSNADRSERTPREYLYLHLGIVSGICERLLFDRVVDRADPRRI